MAKSRDKCRGCLIGGAAGDALGYAVEFLEDDQIFATYGEAGITDYARVDGVALISDDTQMTLFTAAGLLCAKAQNEQATAEEYLSAIGDAYRDWYRTQTEEHVPSATARSFLLEIPTLYARRAPGYTCLSAIEDGVYGRADRPRNNSKGSGGVMRVAPIGLFFGDSASAPDEVAALGAASAALTHGHMLGIIPAAALAYLVHRLVNDDAVPLANAVADMREAMARRYADVPENAEFLALIDRAILLAEEADMDDLEAIRELGEGWVAEEALAISVYCALRYQEDFEAALVAAVNHSGDSDTTGAITGHVIGAYLGYTRISPRYREGLELYALILRLADALYEGA